MARARGAAPSSRRSRRGSTPTRHTSEYPALRRGGDLAGVTADAEPEGDEDDEWPVRAPAKGIRLGIPAAAIVAVHLSRARLLGGRDRPEEPRHREHGTGSGRQLRRPAAERRVGRDRHQRSTGGGLQFPGGGTGGSNATTGTISVVDGDTLYILTASNELVKVRLNPSTTVTRNAKSKAAKLRPGDTVVVQGATGEGGTVQASSVSATAKGVSSTAGGFGGLGGPAGPARTRARNTRRMSPISRPTNETSFDNHEMEHAHMNSLKCPTKE